ncbi:MAG TPA: hypothetical protein VGK23_03865 [Methanomassiliicoccales archaeon]|jgi:hypothetical protein
MVFTQNSDLYAAVQDAGINRVLHHVMVQRPSLFNYGSILPAANPQPICRAIPAVPAVVRAQNPLMTEMDPLPVLMTPAIPTITLDYIVQLTNGAIDFFPGNVFSLPPELNPPLSDQHFAVHFEVCAGLICQPRIRLWPTPLRPIKENRRKDGRTDITCFCLDLFATGSLGITGQPGAQSISMNVSGIEIPELKPEGMEEAIECYALLVMNRGILPKAAEALSALAFQAIPLPQGLGSLTLSASTAVPHNPAVEDNQFKAFINLDNIELNLPPPDNGGGGSSGSGGGTITRTTRPRTRSGTFDLTAAVSAEAFGKIFTAIVKGFHFEKSGNGSYGPFSANYDVAAHLEGGSLEMRDDGTIIIKELDIKWDKLKLDIGIDIPEWCVGGGQVCVLPPYPSCDVPIVGCGDCVTLPSYCFFSGNPDINIPIDLSGLITSEVTISGRVRSFYGVGSGTYNRWQIVVVPTLPLDLDIIDIADTVGDLFKNLVQGGIDNLLNSLGAPGWAIALIDGILGGIDNIIRVILDIPDDIGEWLIDMISQIGIFSSLLNDLYDYIALQIPAVFEIEDPKTVMDQDGALIPVKIPIDFIGVSVDSHEMVIQGDVGN